jgi:peptide/nickel transport system substrate-binding protein
MRVAARHGILQTLLAIAALQPVPALAETVLRARLNADILSSDPAGKRDLNTDAVLLHVIEGLVASRDDGSIQPMLASRWTISPDRRTYRFTLRHGITFHNGAPLTAADVVWTFQHYMAPSSYWRCKSDLGAGGIAQLRSVRADRPDTVVMTLDRPAPMFLKTLARNDCEGSGILQKASVGADGRWLQPIGTGPFAWSGWLHNQRIELARFGGYRSLPGPGSGNGGGKRALVDRLAFQVIPDSSAASAGLLRGSLDVVDGLPSNELDWLRGQPGIRFAASPSAEYFAILFQTRDPALADPRLRRAIALSMDVAGLTRVATRGTGTANSSPIPATSPFFGATERPLITRNLPLARALAKASGYKGQPIALLTSHSPPEAFDAAILVQAMAREAGINLTLTSLDWASHFARYASGHYQAMIFSFSARLDPALALDTLIGDKAHEPRKTWDSPPARALLAQSISTADDKQRQQLFDALDRQFRRDAPAVILFNSRRTAVLRSNVVGYRTWPGETQRLWNVAVGR